MPHSAHPEAEGLPWLPACPAPRAAPQAHPQPLRLPKNAALLGQTLLSVPLRNFIVGRVWPRGATRGDHKGKKGTMVSEHSADSGQLGGKVSISKCKQWQTRGKHYNLFILG